MEKNIFGWIEIAVEDMTRAKTFYKAVFGYEFTDAEMPNVEMAMFPFTENAPYASGALIKLEGVKPSKDGAIPYFSVEDLNVELQKAQENGGKMLVPRTDIGEHGFFAHIEDSEGNRIGIHSMK